MPQYYWSRWNSSKYPNALDGDAFLPRPADLLDGDGELCSGKDVIFIDTETGRCEKFARNSADELMEENGMFMVLEFSLKPPLSVIPHEVSDEPVIVPAKG